MAAFSPLYEREPERYSRSGWEYPRTLEDRISTWSRKAIRLGLGLLLLAVLAVVAVWAIPSWVVYRSDLYRSAWEHTQRDQRLERYLGAPLERKTLPDSYALRDEGRSGHVEFVVRGAKSISARGLGPEALVRCEVEGGEVVAYRRTLFPVGGAW